MWYSIWNFLFRIVLCIVKADHHIGICNKSSKAVLSDYVHPQRVPLREERLEQPHTDFRVQSMISLLTQVLWLLRLRIAISAYESVCVVNLASDLWYEIGCYIQLSNVDIVYLVKQTQRMIKMSVSAMSYEPLLRDMVIEVSKFKYSKHIVDRVCCVDVLVGSRWSCLCGARDPRYTDTPKVWSAQYKVNKRLKFRLGLITHNIY